MNQNLADLLQQCRIRRTIALTISVISDGDPHSMREIEKLTDLRQSEVSIALSGLKDYVTCNGGTEKKAGAPQKILTLTKENFQKYINDQLEKIRNEIEEREQLIGQLKVFL